MLLRQYLYQQMNYSHKLVKKAKSEEENILINDEKKTVRYVLRVEEQLKISFPPEELSSSLAKYSMPLSILYEDNDVIVLDKLADILTIQSRLHPSITILNALLAFFSNTFI